MEGGEGEGELHAALMQAILQEEARVTQVECQSEAGLFGRGLGVGDWWGSGGGGLSG